MVLWNVWNSFFLNLYNRNSHCSSSDIYISRVGFNRPILLSIFQYTTAYFVNFLKSFSHTYALNT